jgi:hypothetical protein
LLNLLLALIAIFVSAVVWKAAQVPGWYITLPAAMGGLFFGWVLPQVGFLINESNAPAGATALVVMVGLCFIASAVGWNAATKPGKGDLVAQGGPLQTRSMVVPVGLLTAVVLAVSLGIELQPEEVKNASRWSGTITVLAFFAQLRIVALSLSLIMVLTKRTIVNLSLAAINIAITFPVAFVLLRRSEMIDVTLALAGSLLFARGRSLSIPVIAVVALVLTVVVLSIGELRQSSNAIYEATGQRPYIFSPDVFKNIDFESAATDNIAKATDFRNAKYIIQYVQQTGEYTWGANTWNDFVFQWVPAQFVGAEIKNGLMVGKRGGAYAGIEHLYGFEYKKGTTSTGFGSAFEDFGYFGAMYFYVIAMVVGKIYRRARSGDPWMQALFLAITTNALTSVTHGHPLFFASFPLFFGASMLLRWMSGYSTSSNRNSLRGADMRAVRNRWH